MAQGIQAGGLGGLHSAAAGLASLAGAGAPHAHMHAGDLDPSACWRALLCFIEPQGRVMQVHTLLTRPGFPLKRRVPQV